MDWSNDTIEVLFARNPDCLAVLSLRDGRRLLGWSSPWPAGESERLLVIDGPQWLTYDRETIDAGEAIVPQAEDAEMVVFVNVLSEPAAWEEEHAHSPDPPSQRPMGDPPVDVERSTNPRPLPGPSRRPPPPPPPPPRR